MFNTFSNIIGTPKNNPAPPRNTRAQFSFARRWPSQLASTTASNHRRQSGARLARYDRARGFPNALPAPYRRDTAVPRGGVRNQDSGKGIGNRNLCS